MSKYETEFKIEYPDINLKNELKNTGFLKYLQEIGCLHSNEVGMGLYQVSQSKYAWILIQWKLKVISRPNWAEKIKIITWPRGIEGPYCLRDYEIYNEKGEKIAIASSKWVLMNMQNERICKATDEIKKRFEPEPYKVFEEELKKLKAPEEFESTYTYKVQRRDIDTNNHVNNIKYLEIAYETLPEEVYKKDFKNIEITYKHSCKLGDEITAFYTNTPQNEHIITIKCNENINAIIKLEE